MDASKVMKMDDETCKIEQFFVGIVESGAYLSKEYLVYSIRRNILDYLSRTWLKTGVVPPWLESLVEYVKNEFQKSNISADAMFEYMLSNDASYWIHHMDYAVLRPINININETGEDVEFDRDVFMVVLTAYILDCFKRKIIDIEEIVSNEQMIYETNQYGLSLVNGVKFERDYFVFDNKAYMYSVLTDTSVMSFTDSMPGFARIILEQVKTGDVLLRLDERLALPLKQAVSYSSLNFDQYYGPQFGFNNSKLERLKTIIVHIDIETQDKLLMVVKQDYDAKREEPFLHIEIETLPKVEESKKSTHCITTFLHGMYYPEHDYFIHIDYTRNQYDFEDYIKKYLENTVEVPIDFYAKKELHYKIWCVENGCYSRETWYNLMIVSLPTRYQKLLNEILV
ncbi:hypothetical protein [Anaerosporobacter sp.]|uniref:hypothetical protein n=1 Tax=Anaerosporobacter sp. TaxID=1872529 RepID=UPI00286F2973|nr:hypothetical protein [Anaerosporobacter sp.]